MSTALREQIDRLQEGASNARKMTSADKFRAEVTLKVADTVYAFMSERVTTRLMSGELEKQLQVAGEFAPMVAALLRDQAKQARDVTLTIANDYLANAHRNDGAAHALEVAAKDLRELEKVEGQELEQIAVQESAEASAQSMLGMGVA